MAAPNIPLFDLQLQPEDLDAVEAVLRSGKLAMGDRTVAFEEAFAATLGVRHAVAVGSCTAALQLAYLAAGVGPGDEVIVPAFTFAATSNAVIYCGGTPVFADIIGPDDLNVDPDHVEALITERTKAVCAVHFAGYPAAVDRLREVCDERGLALIEDAAHAPSATLDGRKLGTFGLAGCFSFFSNKILSVGEGGLLATDDDDVAALARRVRDHGFVAAGVSQGVDPAVAALMPEPPDVVGLGLDLRWDDGRAALALSRLDRLEADIARRRTLSHRYRELLDGVQGVTVPFAAGQVDLASCYVMPLMLDDLGRQGAVRAHMREHHGVQTSLLYPAVNEFSAYVERYGRQEVPRSERAARCEVTVPLFPHMTEEHQARVVDALTEALEEVPAR